MDTAAFIQHLRSLESYSSQIAHIEHIAPRQAQWAELDEPLDPVLQNCLSRQGITSLYSHQAEAINNVRRGNNVMVATPSARGKSLCYNIPVLETLLREPTSRALYLFPVKALAHDQLRVLKEPFSGDMVSPEDFAT